MRQSLGQPVALLSQEFAKEKSFWTALANSSAGVGKPTPPKKRGTLEDDEFS